MTVRVPAREVRVGDLVEAGLRGVVERIADTPGHRDYVAFTIDGRVVLLHRGELVVVVIEDDGR